MEKKEFEYRLIESTKELISFTQSLVTNSISKNVIYLVVPNDRNISDHLNKQELDKLEKLNQLEGQLFEANRVANLLTDSGRVPLWINLEINRATKKQTLVKLICSRRLRKEEDLNKKANKFPPFHPLVPLPPWHKKGEKFNINWQNQAWKMRWYRLTWKWKYEKEI